MTDDKPCFRCGDQPEWVEERTLCDPVPRRFRTHHVCDPDRVEARSHERMVNAIAYERIIGLAKVGVLLDQMCRDLGLDPVLVWRIPRGNEEQGRRDRAAVRFAERAGLAVRIPDAIVKITGGIA